MKIQHSSYRLWALFPVSLLALGLVAIITHPAAVRPVAAVASSPGLACFNICPVPLLCGPGEDPRNVEITVGGVTLCVSCTESAQEAYEYLSPEGCWFGEDCPDPCEKLFAQQLACLANDPEYDCDRDGDGDVDCDDLTKLIDDTEDPIPGGDPECPLTDEQKKALIEAFLSRCGWEWCNSSCGGACSNGSCDDFCDDVKTCATGILGSLSDPDWDDIKGAMSDSFGFEACDGGGCDADMDSDGDIDGDDMESWVTDANPVDREAAIDDICDFLNDAKDCSGGDTPSDVCLGMEQSIGDTLDAVGFGGALNGAEQAEIEGCSTCSDVCDPDDDEDGETEDEGPGDDEECGDDDNGANPTDGGGVDLPNGDKWEHCGDDIFGNVDGLDFGLNGQITSNPDYTAPCVGGASSTFSAFNNLEIQGTDAVLKFGARGAITIDISPEGSTWSVPGPTSQVFKKTDIDTTYAVYQLDEPGRWTVEYWRANEGGETGGRWVQTVDEHVGKIRRRFDNHGNAHSYEYKKVGFDPEDDVRLAAVWLNGEPDDVDPPDARVTFQYVMGSGVNAGKLTSVKAWRLVGVSETQVLTQQVFYTYMDSSDPNLSSALGTDGDLIQVLKYERVDPVPGASAGTDQWNVRVTQFRYHRDADADENGTDADGDGFSYEWGNDHQLKMVLSSEQIEFGLQQNNELNSDNPVSLQKFAQDLVGLGDGAAIYSGASLDVVDLASVVVERYEDYVQVSPGADEYGRILTQYQQSACGCAGSTQGTKFTYAYTDRNSTPESAESITVEESRLDSGTYNLYRTHYYEIEFPETNGLPYLATKAIKDTEVGGSGLQWVWHYDYNTTSRTVSRMYMPSAIASYTGGGGSAPTFNASDGLVYEYEYTTDNRVKDNYVKKGNTGTRTLTTRTLYGDADGLGTEWDADNSRDYYVSKTERYRTVAAGQDPDNADADDVEVMKYFYGFHTDDTSAEDVAWIQSEVEAEIVAENGPGGWYTSYEMFDTLGNNTWSRAADESLTKRTFDANTGQLLSVLRNADETIDGLPDTFGAGGVALNTTSWSDRYDDGGSLLTEYKYDVVGRVQETISPGLVSTYTLREMRETEERPGIVYYAEVTLPHEITAGSSYNGPASITWYNAGGGVIASRSYEVDTGGYTDPPGNDDYEPVFANYDLKDANDEELTRMAIVHDVSGLVTERKEWHSVVGNGAGSGIYTTKNFYDTLGRIDYTLNPVRTLSRSTYDVLDRVTKVEIGLPNVGDDDPDETTIKDISEMFYDHTGTDSSPSQGSGDGNLTLVRQHVDDSGSSSWRVTVNTYDFRNRLLKVKHPALPHEFMALDNLDRVIHRGIFQDEPADTHDFTVTDTDRKRLQTTHYSQRGLVYRTQLAIDPEAAYVASTHAALETHSWFDELGRSVGSWPPNGPGSKTTVDGLGRPAIVYTTDRGGDADPGATGNHADVYDSTNHVAKVNGDVVFEQTRYRYIDDAATAHTGVVDLVTRWQRTHDAVDTDTGDLADFTAPDDDLVITTYNGTFYDGADRVIQSVNYGTNIDDEFKFGGTVPTINQALPPDWDTTGSEIVVETAYNARGLAEQMTEFSESGAPDVAEITMYLYDDLNRRVAVIENQKNVDFDDITWNTADVEPDRWTFTDVGGASGELDEDRVTSYVYDGISNVIIQTAHQPVDTTAGDQDQVTQYIFGVTTGANPDDSELNSNDLLGSVIYPDTEGGESDADRTVLFAYNRQNEPSFKEDQAGTEHTYTRDLLGRVTKDEATALGTNIDGAIRAITIEFYDYGPVKFVESEDGSSVVKNGIGYRYDDLWQLTDLYQDMTGEAEFNASTGAPLNDTKRVQYLYDTDQMADGNHSRLDRTTYPDGEAINHKYGKATASDDRISRVRSIREFLFVIRPPVYVQYDYIGLGMIAEVDYADADVQLDYTASHDGKRQTQGNTDNPGKYPGYDQFGRVVRHIWVDGSFTTGSGGNPNVPPIVELAYSYDKQSNRLTAYNENQGWSLVDYQYDYDGVDRLAEAKRGVWNGSTFTAGINSQRWTLDMMGNWTKIETNEDTTYGYESDEADDRDHADITDANELDQRVLVGDGPGPPADLTLDLTYDKAGNLRTEQRKSGTSAIDWTYTHDAWNRLVKVEVGATPVDRAIFKYNGLNWLIIKQSDTDSDGTLDQQRMRYYSGGWQMCEERIDDDATFPTDPDAADIDRHVQYVNGIRYIDDVILHREDGDVDGTYDDTWYHLTDVQFSTVAIIDDAANLKERVTYDPYGSARHHRRADLDGDGDVDGADKTLLENNWGNFGEGDLDRSGTVGVTDLLILLGNWGAALADGLISSSSSGGVDNQIGYDSYVFNAETRQYCVRHRTYDPIQGRWIERDPPGYADGMNLYEYAGANPLLNVDPRGTDFIALAHRRVAHREQPLFYHYSLEYWESCDDVSVGDHYRPGNMHLYDESTERLGAVELLANSNFRTWSGGGRLDYYYWRVTTATVSVVRHWKGKFYGPQSRGSERMIIIYVADSKKVSKVWRTMLLNAQSYAYGEWGGSKGIFVGPLKRWPQSKYQLFGNNSNTFVRVLMRMSPTGVWEISNGWHPGYNFPKLVMFEAGDYTGTPWYTGDPQPPSPK